MHVGIALAGCLFLSACQLPEGLDARTPIGSIGLEHKPQEMAADNCTVRGELRLPKGASLNCDVADEDAPAASPGPADEPVEPPPEVQGPPAPVEPPPEDPLAETIREAEDGSNLAYCDPSGLHIGDGSKVHLSDAEREAQMCAELKQAREEAQRILGAFTWATLDQVRKDVIAELCYWSPCAGFTDTIRLVRAGDFEGAAVELLRNSEGDGPSGIVKTDMERAHRMARWLHSGIRH